MISLDEAASRRWSVAVVGAGPAGALSALLLARRGVPTLLIDRAAFPRPKVCGCCLNARAIAALAEAGLGGLCARLGAVPTKSVLLACGGKSALVPMGGVSLSRSALDAALVREAVEAGARFLPSTEARRGEGKDDRLELSLRQGGDSRSVAAAVVLAADGLGGRLSGRAEAQAGSRLGAGVVLEDAPSFYSPGTVHMACGPAGYVGLVRLEDGRLDVACALDGDSMKDGPAPLAAATLRAAGWPVPDGMLAAPWRGTLPLTRSAGRVAHRRLFVLGDAAGYVEPFTGEGMAWAMASALAVAPLAARPWRPALASEWERAHQRIVADRQLACRALAAVLRRPWLTSLLVSFLSWCPAAARPVLRSLEAR